MEINGPQADELSVKTQVTVTKKEQISETSSKEQKKVQNTDSKNST